MSRPASPESRQPGGIPCRRGATRAASACVGAVGLDIGQLADVAGWRPGQDERVEVRIALDALDPPVGRIRVSGDDSELGFTGWLGLLRVLYQVMGAPAGPQAAVPDREES